jgi:hypothetical protein
MIGKEASMSNFKVFWRNLDRKIYWDVETPRKLGCMTRNIVTTSANLLILVCYFQRSFRLAKETVCQLRVFYLLNRLSELIKILYKIISAGKHKYSEEPLPSATLSATNLLWLPWEWTWDWATRRRRLTPWSFLASALNLKKFSLGMIDKFLI